MGPASHCGCCRRSLPTVWQALASAQGLQVDKRGSPGPCESLQALPSTVLGLMRQQLIRPSDPMCATARWLLFTTMAWEVAWRVRVRHVARSVCRHRHRQRPEKLAPAGLHPSHLGMRATQVTHRLHP